MIRGYYDYQSTEQMNKIISDIGKIIVYQDTIVDRRKKDNSILNCRIEGLQKFSQLKKENFTTIMLIIPLKLRRLLIVLDKYIKIEK